jgi:hypothetical protein
MKKRIFRGLAGGDPIWKGWGERSHREGDKKALP